MTHKNLSSVFTQITNIMLRTSIFLFVIVAVATAFSPLSQSSARSSTALNMAVEEVKVGDKIPSVDMAECKPDYGRPETVNIAELCAGKKVAIFAVPGAFTPGCSKSHLPSFISAQDELKAKGVELTICVATNDAFVMEVSLAVGKDQDVFPTTVMSYSL